MTNQDAKITASKLIVANNGLDKALSMLKDVEIVFREQGKLAEANKLKRYIATLSNIRKQTDMLM